MPIVTRIKGFKPVFGNERHIDIIEELGKLNKDILLRDELVKQRKQSVALAHKIAERKKKIRGMVEYDKQKTGN